MLCQLFVQPCGNVRENLQLVGLHQQLVAGTEARTSESACVAERMKLYQKLTETK